MNKDKIKTIILVSCVVILFGTFFGLIGFAGYRQNYVHTYIGELGRNLTGDVCVYAVYEDVNTKERTCLLLNDEDRNLMTKSLIVGTQNLVRKKDKPTGDSFFLFTTYANDDRIDYVLVERLANDKVLVELSNIKGRRRIVSDDVRYDSLVRILTGDRGSGVNIPANEKLDSFSSFFE